MPAANTNEIIKPTRERLAKAARVMTVSADGESTIGSAVGALLRSGKIGGAEFVAAERWHADFALAEFGARDSAIGSSSGARALDGRMIASLAAVDAYRAARAALGSYGDTLMRAVVADGMSLRAVGRGLDMSSETVAGSMVATLRRLSEHYAERDGGRRMAA